MKQFVEHYGDESISKEAIFHYTYAVLHHPSYRQKYEQNLKRDFPRLPFYEDFWQWAQWGKALLDCHINYESAKPYPLERIENQKDPAQLKSKLKADKEAGLIILDEKTSLKGVPAKAWDYKLGNRSALEWVLDQYKEKKPKDATIAAKFDNYRFADYKEAVIELLKQLCSVSIETVSIIEQMPS
ncbi:MAG: type ISP restriction/modification enzyme [Deinococcales bacterium]